MNDETIQKLAKAHATLIMNYTGVTQNDAMRIAGAVMGYVMGLGARLGPAADTKQLQTPQTGAQVASVSADNPGEGAVLSPKGYRCYCSLCKGDVYELTSDIKGRNMGVNALLAAFRPLGNAPTLTRDMLNVLKDKNNNTFIDCPVCKGDKTLMIIGQPTREIDARTDTTPQVGSVSGGEVGLS